MKSVTAAEFQGQCSKLIKEVMETGVPVVIMENGQPVAQLGPIVSHAPTLAGAHKGQLRIVGDLLEPLGDEWEATL
ncbi:MAG: type II toxin-antitoxin system prevent-host-death family antitoxin [Deltaproteobacteria bacterium]|nr:type II toxin-antitoxin system prevent-host-death family antitoxin [Deltaproteobacteria bacterium]